ncbi:SLOG family protein [Streptomyces sp. NPDC046977]|uniref:SLOG family protein n=1 Tax=Streptomyces sp. NPDC046977 TaxID=3154703 RepID=UPI0033C519A9
MTPQPYRILVTGSRDWNQMDIVHGALATACFQNVPAVIVHGACPSGADAIASWWVRGHRIIGLTEERHPADWRPGGRFDRAAGFRRNAHMVALGADVCLAFIRNGSNGASHTAALAEQAGIEVRRWTA